MSTETATTSRKSIKLTKEELRSLKAYRKKFATEVDCAISIGIDRLVLNRVLLVGSCSQATIDKIRVSINKESGDINNGGIDQSQK
jgi:hypothetical protein